MQKVFDGWIHRFLFGIALAFILYMPLHVFIAQSASFLTGGLEVWKAAKDVLLFGLLPLLLYMSYRQGLWQDRIFRWLLILGAGYGLLHGLYLVFDGSDDTYSALVASVYNTRVLGYLLLGCLVSTAKNGAKYLRYLLTAAVLIASLVALFGIAQYFLPKDMLEHVGYSLERGVKPMFFIDDRPELPRVMSTLKDPNSFGAYLILPMLLTGLALIKRAANEKLFVRPFRREVLAVMLTVQAAALFLSFSRGALLAAVLSVVTTFSIVTRERVLRLTKKYWYVALVLLSIIVGSAVVLRNTAFVQDYIIHAAESTDEQDPNAKRLTLQADAIEEIVDEPEGHGPGTAGLIAITNPKGGILTENYYLQIGYEVGWLGLGLFVAILSIVTSRLMLALRRRDEGERLFATVLLASLVGYAFYSLLIHLWSNEAIALQWWLLAGTGLGLYLRKNNTPATK